MRQLRHIIQLGVKELLSLYRDPVLLFLMGYELWFDDRRGEARVFFKRAAAKSPDPTFCYRFVPPLPVIPLFLW